MYNRIKTYEFRKSVNGLRLILWAPLERGGKTVVGSFEGPPGTKPSDMMKRPSVQKALPDKVRSI